VALVSNSTGSVDDSPGPITQTGNALDLALDGPGYMAVRFLTACATPARR
jgi:flagellar basal body rod protein FlgF